MALIPAGLGRLAFPAFGFASELEKSPSPEFHLHPHYRAPMPLDALLLKKQAGLDDFVTEKYADQIAAILAQWNSGFLQSPQNVAAIEKVLVPAFSAASLRPVESRIVRTGPPIEVRRNTFSRLLSLGRKSFLEELPSAVSRFTKILTAEFQVTSVNASAMQEATGPGQLSTRVRYEIVGTGRDFYREQLVGSWELLWEASASDRKSVV